MKELIDFIRITPVKITVDPNKGASLWEVQREAAIMSLKDNVKVEFTFNNKTYIADPVSILSLGIKEV